MSDQEQATDQERRRWEEFGAWLKELRLDRGETRAHIAELAGMALQTLAALEAGGFRRASQGAWIIPNPKDETLDALARALKVDAEELFRRVDRYENRPQTKRSLRRRNLRSVSGGQDRERITALEHQNAELRDLNVELRRLLDQIEERLERMESKLGIDPAAEQQQPQRKRASG